MNADNDFNEEFWGTSNIIVDYEGLCDESVPWEQSVQSDLKLSQISSLGKIKIPQNKEILVTLSTQIDILTVNQATSKKPSGSTEYWGNIGGTSAYAGVVVELFAKATDGTLTSCLPGKVTMASRAVELKNLIGGNVTYEDCTTDGCTTKIANVELASSIGLAMDTAAAHSFQFLCVNMESDAYDVFAKFSLDAKVDDICDAVLGGECGTIADFAAARVAFNKRMLTVQEVRLANQIEL